MEKRSQTETGLSLEDLLTEFDQAVQDFHKGAPSQYGHRLAEMKRQACDDSGIDDSESSCTSPGSSLSASQEDLNATPSAPKATATASRPKARLGDTHDLEAFIADLDKVLEEM